ncbi:MAG: MoxR family ATPase [Candidatus Sumerlaeia bacterium]|nr:MoxR family ATPase [Candidatus Sumerlaeia bacterium]
MSQDFQQQAEEFRSVFTRLSDEVQKVIVGNDDVIEGVLAALFAGGHVLLEGVPGLGKTMLVRTLGEVLDLPFNRIQFTPDLMPADIVGTNVVQEDPDTGRRGLQFEEGPIFTSLVLADEINRATPKTQSAMLECMQEKQVTVSGKRYTMDAPFFVMATQNPLEMEGTYPLPEAQLDRFLFKLMVPFPGRKELATILDRTTRRTFPTVDKVIDRDQVLRWMDFIRGVEVAEHVQDYAVRLVLATHPESEFATDQVRKYVRYGSSPRGAQGLILGGKIKALRAGRANLAFADIAAMALPVLRHRIMLNFEAEAEGLAGDTILRDLLDKVPRDTADFVAAQS